MCNAKLILCALALMSGMLTACSSKDNTRCNSDQRSNIVEQAQTLNAASPVSSPLPNAKRLRERTKSCSEVNLWHNYNVAMGQILEFSQFYVKLRLNPTANKDVFYTFHQNTGSTQAPDCQSAQLTDMNDDNLV
ncbi:hypothetical protein P886_2415 [Alteromonadaceae bacterium 2753L.S.0a.02]|nr:hypothetical protein P886_2415 [Alteromonadaceae bacterium 2753L.S.0a.02]